MLKVKCYNKILFKNWWIVRVLLKHDSVFQRRIYALDYLIRIFLYLFWESGDFVLVASNTLLSLKCGWLHVSKQLLLWFFLSFHILCLVMSRINLLGALRYNYRACFYNVYKCMKWNVDSLIIFFIHLVFSPLFLKQTDYNSYNKKLTGLNSSRSIL